MTILLMPFGIISILCYSSGLISPIWLSMFLSCSLIVLLLAKTSFNHNLLSIYFIVLYTLPFIHGFEYFGFDFESATRPHIMWGLQTNPYTFSEPIVSRMFMLGFIGLLAMVLGVLLVNAYSKFTASFSTSQISNYRGQSLPVFLALVGLAFLLSWLNTPQDSIFLQSYGSSGISSNRFNFNASWMLSYILLTALFVDQEFMRNSKWQLRLKRITLFGSIFCIVVFHQFSRGDRECVTLLAALALLFAVKLLKKSSATRRPSLYKIIGLISFTGVLFLAANIVGALRSVLSLHLSTQELSEQIYNALARFYAGTWSAVLLTPLSVTGDDFLGLMEQKMGTTYLDSLLSLIPSPIARLIDYVRPIEGTRGPAWDMRFGIGGTHISVVPYMNFGIIGVFCFMFLQAAIFAWIDNAVRYNNNFSKIFLFGSLIVVGPHWYWYGDMSLVRGLMAYALTWLLYCFLAFKAPRPQAQQLS